MTHSNLSYSMLKSIKLIFVVTCIISVESSSCDYISTTYQQFMDVALKVTAILESGLGLFFKKEIVPDYKYEVCNAVGNANRRTLIEKPPQVLCVQMKR